MEILKLWGKMLLNVALPFAFFGVIVLIEGIVFGFIDYCASDEPFLWSFGDVVTSSPTILVAFFITLGTTIYMVDKMQEIKK